MLGLAVALVAGVPLATWLGQRLSWRAAYWVVVLPALGGRLADWAVFRSIVGGLVAMGAVLALVALTAAWPPALFAGVFLVSVTGSVFVICLQMRLMETAGDAQMLGAALNHSALNLANALGA